MAVAYVLAFVSLSLAVVAPSVQAHVAVFDEYWTQRQTDALQKTMESYDPNPYNVTDHLNYHAALAMETNGAGNGTRRELTQVGVARKTKRRGGRYESLNAIDKCWRGTKNWDKNRKKLADCVLGFGRKTTGGKAGPIYVITDASDDDLMNPKPGTLRHAVTRDTPLWIIFDRSMIIKLQQELIINSDKTIDGRGASVHITGGKSNAWSPAPKNPIPRKFAIRPQPGTKVRRLTKDAGTLGCKPGKSC
ncbi:unnamed protein product [Thlaspi arvense]|uniref:Pectate lyase N-terminal domain-containing protein n=1 Tax=Thlaspi arvense TaxID=13288 RepID=A0AAU9RLA5_THLAR|nr:unnamed protein product [Thlaspi arvense]